MGDLRGSLYDLFGYFIPGLFSAIGVWLILWAVAWPGRSLTLAPIEEPIPLFMTVVLTYTLGHVIQAVGNLIPQLPGVDIATALTYGYDSAGREEVRGALLSSSTVAAIDRTLEIRFGSRFVQLPPNDRFAFIDEGRVLAEREGDREVYVYHYGFYRGMLVACVILVIGLSLRLATGPNCVSFGSYTYCATWRELAILIAATGGSGFAFWRRLQRFAEYRLVRAVMLWLTVTNYSAGDDSLNT